jgi:hypothetical protein
VGNFVARQILCLLTNGVACRPDAVPKAAGRSRLSVAHRAPSMASSDHALIAAAKRPRASALP